MIVPNFVDCGGNLRKLLQFAQAFAYFILGNRDWNKSENPKSLFSHTHTHTHTLSVSLSVFFSLSLSLSLSHAHTHAPSLMYALYLTHTCSLYTCLSLTHTHAHKGFADNPALEKYQNLPPDVLNEKFQCEERGFS